MKRLIPAFLILIFLGSCGSDNTPIGIIPKNEMAELLTDLQLIDGYVSNLPQDSSNKVGSSLYLSAFKKHNTDSAEFNKSLKYYSINPKKFGDIYTIVKANMDTLQKAEEKRLHVESEKAEKASKKAEKHHLDSIKKASKKQISDSIIAKKRLRQLTIN